MNLENITLVADQDYFPLVFALKNKHPEYSWKVIGREDLLDRVSFSFANDPIPALIKQGISYNDAKKYLNIFRAADFGKNEKLAKIFASVKGYTSIDDLGLYEIKSKPLFLLEMNEDVEIHALLKRKGIEYTDISFADLGAQRKAVPPVYSFQDRIAQYHYIYSEIRSRLLKDPSLASRITVLINDTCDIYMAKYVGDLYGIKNYATYGSSFLSDSKVRTKVSQIYKGRQFSFTEEELSDPSIKQLSSLVEFYGLDKLSDFEFAYSNLIEITTAMTYRERLDDSGITLENRFHLSPDDIVYVTCFQYGVFYKEFDDKNVLSDAELVEIEANPSYAKTNLDRRKKKNYVLYNEIPFLSRARQHQSDKIYNSQLLEELDSSLRERGEEGYDENDLWEKRIIKKTLNNEDGVYTTKASNFYVGDQYDKKFYYGKVGEHRSYDHKFKGIISGTPCKRSKWSLTNLERYPLCPFKYYMDTIIPDEQGDMHNMWFGTMAHSLFEKIYDPNYDFDVEWDIAIARYQNEVVKAGFPFDDREKALLEISKDWLRASTSFIRKTKKGMGYVGELAEQTVFFSLTDNSGFQYQFSGKIDKILLTEQGAFRYYTVIDYKSGSEKFDVDQAKNCFLGANIQVPLYVYALQHQIPDPFHKPSDPNFVAPITGINGYSFGACGIEPICFKPNHFFRKEKDTGGIVNSSNLEANIKLGGIRTSNEAYKNSVDQTVPDKDGKAIPQDSDLLGQKLFFSVQNADENILGDKALNYSKYNLDDLIEDAKAGALDNIENILANKFDIAPTSSDLLGDKRSLQCKYCSFRDVCYRRPYDVKSYKEMIDAKYGTKNGFTAPSPEEEEEDDE